MPTYGYTQPLGSPEMFTVLLPVSLSVESPICRLPFPVFEFLPFLWLRFLAWSQSSVIPPPAVPSLLVGFFANLYTPMGATNCFGLILRGRCRWPFVYNDFLVSICGDFFSFSRQCACCCQHDLPIPIRFFRCCLFLSFLPVSWSTWVPVINKLFATTMKGPRN